MSLSKVQVSQGGKAYNITYSDKDELVGNALQRNKSWEPWIANIMSIILDERSVSFDIGANIGVHTVLMAMLSPEGCVHAFEPDPYNFQILSANIKMLR